MGMGVRFYFSDSTLLISSTLLSHVALERSEMKRSDLQIVRTPPCPRPEESWSFHKRRVAEMEAAGKEIASTSSFDDYVEISERERRDLRSRLR